MSNIIEFRRHPIDKDVDSVLERAKGQYESVVLLGYDNDGSLQARASPDLEAQTVLWLIERFKAKLLDGDYHDE